MVRIQEGSVKFYVSKRTGLESTLLIKIISLSITSLCIESRKLNVSQSAHSFPITVF